MNEKSRSYSFSLVCYADPAKLEAICRQCCRHYAFATHDCDVLENGDKKPVHTHLLVVMKNACTLSAVRRKFTIDGENCLAQPLGDKVACFRYLTHTDNPEKYQYSSDVVVSSGDYWLDEEQQCDEKNEALLSMLDELRGKHNLRDMVRKYGRDFVLHYQSYKMFAEALDYEESMQEKAERQAVRYHSIALNGQLEYSECPSVKFIVDRSQLF